MTIWLRSYSNSREDVLRTSSVFYLISYFAAGDSFRSDTPDSSGQILGVTFDVTHPESRAGWKSSKTFDRG